MNESDFSDLPENWQELINSEEYEKFKEDFDA